MLIRIEIAAVNNKFHFPHTTINNRHYKPNLLSTHSTTHKKLMHSNTNFYAQNLYYAKSPASLFAIAKDSSNFLFATATKPASLQIPAAIFYAKRCLVNNFPFPLPLTLSALLFHFPLTNAVATNVCQRTNKPNHTIPPSYLIIDPLRHQQQNSYFHHFHSLTILAHL